jgi:site-specific DNA recombinase
MPASTGERVALYARVSGEEQKQGHNIDSQINELTQFAAQREWQIVNTYRDEAWSGALLARPALDKMRDDAGKKLFDIVLINDVDRLARDVTHLGIIKRDLERLGIRVVFRKIPSDGSPTHNLLVNILGSFAEFERELILDRTRRGRRHKVEALQQYIGCTAPFGYVYTPERTLEHSGILTINPEEAVIVREIFRLVDEEGLSARRVAVRMSSTGFKTRKGHSVWQGSSVLKILRCQAYCGTWYYNKSTLAYPQPFRTKQTGTIRKISRHRRPESDWIAVPMPDSLQIIQTDQWVRVQRRLDQNRLFSPRNSHHEYLLSGLIHCGGCGGSYVGNPSHGYFNYVCTRRCGKMTRIRETFLDASVWKAVEKALRNPKLFASAIKDIERQPSPAPDGTAQLEAALESLAAQETRVLEAYRLEVLNPEQLSRELGTITGRRNALEKQRQEATGRSVQAKSIQGPVKQFCDQIVGRLTNLTFETKRAILRELIRKIVFEGNQIRIVGIIPISGTDEIAHTQTHLYGHNPPGTIAFAFTAPIIRDPARFRAASMANLGKANEVLARKRRRKLRRE